MSAFQDAAAEENASLMWKQVPDSAELQLHVAAGTDIPNYMARFGGNRPEHHRNASIVRGRGDLNRNPGQ
jgi:hypothetical protein